MVKNPKQPPICEVKSRIPYRLALAGGWIDQPFVSRLNPNPPGSMVVVCVEATFRFMDRCGMATSTREAAAKLWGGKLPKGNRDELVRNLYKQENKGKAEPSGSQDMVGLMYPGVSRLDYDFGANGGIFPTRIESLTNKRVARWLERVIHIVPVAQRPPGYSPLGIKRLEPRWIERLGESGRACFDAIAAMDIKQLGSSMNECMECWERLLPRVIQHPAITVDLKGLLRAYQRQSAGAMYSGCGGGYLYVVSEEAVPGSFQMTIRTE